MTFKQGHNVGKEKLDLTGQKFAFLTAIRYLQTLPREKENKKSSRAVWLFSCDCGNEVELVGTEVKFGIKTHCGCLSKNSNKFSKTPLFRRYHNMNSRCYNPKDTNYPNYGGRGITVCEEWRKGSRLRSLNFMNWAMSNGYEEHLTLDRINVNGNYCPENCRWVTQKVQQNNRRDTRLITFPDGKTIPFTQACEEFGISCSTATTRINRGNWDPYLAVSIPVNKKA